MNEKDKKEAVRLIKAASKKSKLPNKETNILDWTLPELNAYIKSELKGLSVSKKLKFGQELTKRINNEKKLQNR